MISKMVGVMKYMEELAVKHYPDVNVVTSTDSDLRDVGLGILSNHYPKPADKAHYKLDTASINFLYNLVPKGKSNKRKLQDVE